MTDQTVPWKPGHIATGNRFIPNLPVVTHDGQNRLFYDDLIKGQTVLLQFMSIAHAAAYPAVRNMKNVQRLLGRRLGRDVCIYSLTVEPEQDTPNELRSFAARVGAQPGWSFLTGDPVTLAAIRLACFFHGSVTTPTEFPTHKAREPKVHGVTAHKMHDCSLGLLRYGNEVSGLWGSVPAKTDPAMIVERLSWITPKAKPTRGTKLKRKGPLSKEVKHYRRDE